MIRYLACDSCGNELKRFDSEDKAVKWLERYCYHDGINWIIYNLSRFPYRVTSRVLHLHAE